MRHKIILCILLGLLGVLLGLADAETGRAMCYYGLDRSLCEAQFSPVRIALEALAGGALGYAAGLIVYRLLMLVRTRLWKDS